MWWKDENKNHRGTRKRIWKNRKKCAKYDIIEKWKSLL